MDAVDIIHGEHRRIAAVLHCLEHLAQGTKERSPRDEIPVFDAILEYLQAFPERFHHPKEEQYLFATLWGRCPELQEAISRLRSEHDGGEHRLLALSRALEGLRRNADDGEAAFRQAVVEYVAFEREHMRLEEQDILPRVREVLSSYELKRMDDAFIGNSDPLFGDAPQARYRELYNRILAVAPEPYGFARAC
ncbi:MAG TPA: hemerythrin domain-containing protein [Alphaproteobacteria bacterium]|nr:hemerythrin domain-containing protein [Alphaproteobacteria bacterium]